MMLYDGIPSLGKLFQNGGPLTMSGHGGEHHSSYTLRSQAGQTNTSYISSIGNVITYFFQHQPT